MMGDMSVNCPACGSNPHEECRMPGMGNHKAIDCLVNPVAADSRMDDMTEPETMLEHIEEGHPSMMIRRSFEKAWHIVKGENDCTKCGKYIHFQDEPHWSAGVCEDCDKKNVVKYETNHIPEKKKSKFGEKFQRKLDSLKEGARGVPEKFSDLTPTTPERDIEPFLEANKHGQGTVFNRIVAERKPMNPQPSPFKPSQALIDRARSGTHTMPGSSKYRRDED